MSPRALLAAVLAIAAACGSDDGGDGDPVGTPPLTPDAPLPQMSGVHAGRYLVPAPAELAEAAIYPIDHVEWEVEDGLVNLHYDLPEGLVGGAIPVSLAGELSAGATTVELSGDTATGLCVASASLVTCREDFFGLGSLPVSMAVVTARAGIEYAGPAAHREELARLFDADPIGFVEIDLDSLVAGDD